MNTLIEIKEKVEKYQEIVNAGGSPESRAQAYIEYCATLPPKTVLWLLEQAYIQSESISRINKQDATIKKLKSQLKMQDSC